jgi:hypothetical protein
LHPFNECLLLSGVWIDSVTVSKWNHSTTIEDLLKHNQPLNVNCREIESLQLTWGSYKTHAKPKIMAWVL